MLVCCLPLLPASPASHAAARQPLLHSHHTSPACLCAPQGLLRRRGEPWPRLTHLSVSCPFVDGEVTGNELIGSLPALRSLDWAELRGTQQVRAAAVWVCARRRLGDAGCERQLAIHTIRYHLPAQAWGAIAAAPNLRSQLTRLCLGIPVDNAPRQRGTASAFAMPSLAPLSELQVRPCASSIDARTAAIWASLS